ncbi:hypothetical protein [Burkholderia gladioli]|uniref:hypothetical protein n=1 Tax=Burkholderia gladioli TaxID=28095 RepID=UPI001640145D|nr:hypothetical protein [Burkholderia gladioli]
MSVDPAMLGHFKHHYVARLELFVSVFKERFLGAFGSLEEEVQAVSDGAWAQWCGHPYHESGVDPSIAAGDALQIGVDYFSSLMGARQAYINLAAVGLYHAWEQQVLEFFRRYVIGEARRCDVSAISLVEFERVAERAGVRIKDFPSASVIKTLRLCANTVKHAEGPSALQLRKRRPDLFVHPGTHAEETRSVMASRTIYAPLSGDDLYVTDRHLDEFLAGTIQYWTDMTQTLLTDFKGEWFPVAGP